MTPPPKVDPSDPDLVYSEMQDGGMRRYNLRTGEVVGISTFGESAPAPELFQHFGLTAESVVSAVRRVLAAPSGRTGSAAPLRS